MIAGLSAPDESVALLSFPRDLLLVLLGFITDAPSLLNARQACRVFRVPAGELITTLYARDVELAAYVWYAFPAAIKVVGMAPASPSSNAPGTILDKLLKMMEHLPDRLEELLFPRYL